MNPGSGHGHEQDGEDYDAIVVGARAAGAATAMLLARRGWRVLALDRTQRGRDTLSTHALMKGGVLQLHRWGLLDAVKAAGTPPIRTTTFHYGDESVTVPMKPVAGIDSLFAPRRTVLDPILADAAASAGAEVRFGTTVTALLRAGDGRVRGVEARGEAGTTSELRASLVIGADGAKSFVARSVGAAVTHRAAYAGSVVYAYFDAEDGAFDGYEWCYRPGASAGVIPTNGGVLAWVGLPPHRFDREVRRNVEAAFWRRLESTAPDVRDRLGALARTSHFHSTRGWPGYLRRCAGPGWALVGDASHFKDPLSAHGLTDALRDAELLARAAHVGFDDASEMVAAMTRYERERDLLSLPLLAVSDTLASYRWTMEEVRVHLRAMSDAMRDEVRMMVDFDESGSTESAA